MEKYDYSKLLQLFIQSELSLTKFSKLVNIGRDTLSSNFKKLGYKIINKLNLTKFDEHIFDEIDTEEKAYWLGFIFADGYISSKTYTFELSLKSSDIDHLIKFNKFMKYIGNNVKLGKSTCNNKIFFRCRWSITNKHLWNTLNSYGCTPRKSLTLKFPNISIFKNKDLVYDFIRGYFDGDGCFSTSKYKNSNSITPNCSIIGTHEFLEELSKYINMNLKIYYKDRRHSNSNTYVLPITKSNYFYFMPKMYENATIYLDRKHKRYLFFKDNWSQSLDEFNEIFADKLSENLTNNT